MLRRFAIVSIASISLYSWSWSIPGPATASSSPSKAPGPPPAHEDKNNTLLRDYNIQARQAYEDGQFDVAEARYQAALKVAPQPRLKVVLWSNLGAVFREQHKYVESEKAFKEALAVAGKNNFLSDPCAVTAMQQYAALLRKIHRVDEADALDSRAMTAASINSGLSLPSAGLSSSSSGLLPQTSVQSSVSTAAATHEAASVSTSEAEKLVSDHPDVPNNWLILLKKYEEAQDWTHAITTLEAFRRTFPAASKKSSMLLAEYYERTGDYQSAITHAKAAIESDPRNGDYYLELYRMTVGSGDVKDALEIEKNFVENFAGHPKHQLVAQHHEYAEADFKYQQERAAFKNHPLPDERKQSFPLNQMPLKVFIHNRYEETVKLAPNIQVTEDTPADLIQRSCDAWAAASANKVSFQLTDREDQSNIDVFLTDDPNGLEQGYAQGITEDAAKGENKKRIRILLIHSDSGKPLDKAEFLECCMHEFGHALGLSHSGSIEDVMYPSMHQRAMTALSRSDTDRVTLLYTSGSN